MLMITLIYNNQIIIKIIRRNNIKIKIFFKIKTIKIKLFL